MYNPKYPLPINKSIIPLPKRSTLLIFYFLFNFFTFYFETILGFQTNCRDSIKYHAYPNVNNLHNLSTITKLGNQLSYNTINETIDLI